ncbi:hypothetical protein Tco_1004569 [Tanacetum coccineum]|uniref:Uncharacterized protein n=1 Tax=Tanacetum coccineum TaxID=301880 RepID=A0ABQ5FC91_9ASTR
MQQPPPNNNFVPQPSFDTNYLQEPMPNLDEINDPTTAMNMALVLLAKAFKLNYSTPTNNNQRISSNPRNRQIAQPGMNMVVGNRGNQFRQYAGQNMNNQIEYNAGQFVGNQSGYNLKQNARNQVGSNAVQNLGIQNVWNQNRLIIVPRIANQNVNGNVVAARAEGNDNGNNGDIKEIKEVNANYILMANMHQASSSGTQADKAPVYDSDGSAEFAKPSILGKAPLQPLRNQSVVIKLNAFQSERPKFPKTWFIPKVVENIDLTKPVTSHSVPKSQDSKFVNNEKVCALRMFRINPLKNFRVDNFVSNKHVKASIRTKSINVSQPRYITKKDVNSNTSGFSPTKVKSTAKTRRPQPRSNPKNNRVPFKSKSSYLSHNLKKIEENHRNLLSSNNQEHASSKCNNIKLAIWNEKSEVICAT